MDEISEENRNLAKKLNVEVCHFSDIEKEGKNSRQPVIPPNEDTLATICYTSGVTGMTETISTLFNYDKRMKRACYFFHFLILIFLGNPKGVTLTHKNFISQIASSQELLGDLSLCPKDIHISYLPLAHVFERIVLNSILAYGGAVGFYFSFLSLFNDIVVCI